MRRPKTFFFPPSALLIHVDLGVSCSVSASLLTRIHPSVRALARPSPSEPLPVRVLPNPDHEASCVRNQSATTFQLALPLTPFILALFSAPRAQTRTLSLVSVSDTIRVSIRPSSVRPSVRSSGANHTRLSGCGANPTALPNAAAAVAAIDYPQGNSLPKEYLV